MTEAESQLELFRPIDFDRMRVEGNSLREFSQVLKIQFVSSDVVQVVFDRVHKLNLKLSKPLGYIRFTGQDCIKLAGMFLASASVLASKSAQGPDAKKKVCNSALNFFSAQIKEIAENLIPNIIDKLLQVTNKE